MVSKYRLVSVSLYRVYRTRFKRWVAWKREVRQEADEYIRQYSTIKVQWVSLQEQEEQLACLVCLIYLYLHLKARPDSMHQCTYQPEWELLSHMSTGR